MINWNEPSFGEEEEVAVLGAIRDNYVNEGPRSKELEKKIRDYLGVNHVILTANATAGLFLATKADAIIQGKENFEVIVPDLTMIASATSVGWAGGKPVLVDVSPRRLTIDPWDVEDSISEKTTAIMPVHILGRACDMERLERIADENSLTIIEDAAGALGSKDDRGRYLGTIGKVGVYSLQSNKIITSGQGGVIVTNDDTYFEEIRRLRDFGRFSNKEFIHAKEGYNLKFNDLAAALALPQFERIEERKENLLHQRSLYEDELGGVNEVRFFEYKLGEIPLWIDVLVEDRKNLAEHLKRREIQTRECWPAVHQNPPYAHDARGKEFPTSTYMANNVLWFPNGPKITDDQIVYISKEVKDFYGA